MNAALSNTFGFGGHNASVIKIQALIFRRLKYTFMETPANISNTEIQNFLIRRLGEKEADEIMEYINTGMTKSC